MDERKDEKRRKKGGIVEKMNEKSLVEMQIPAEEVGNIDELVREGYYGSRSDAIRDIIRRGAAQLRSRYWFVETKGGEER
ncbi:MAG: ribbon-helix-helix domain-containing protein [Euryarchaeota archaeon]|nr:ribbon-helix-helix domain-containing protein [Euryarchaeota archaeon]CBH39093.1 hypothetical protein, ribbon-helix-helix protein copG family [uncultured archaeon]